MFIVDYLYLTPNVYKKALERTQQILNYADLNSTLIYNKNSYHLTNLLYNDIIHFRYLLYKITKYTIELWDNCIIT